MHKTNSIHRMAKAWQRNLVIRFVLLVTSLAIFLSSIAILLLHLPVWSVVICVVVSAIIITIIQPPRKIADVQVASFLNSNYPHLEESAQLLLMIPAQRNMLQQLQSQKTLSALAVIKTPIALTKPLKTGLATLFAGIALSAALVAISKYQGADSNKYDNKAGDAVHQEIIPAAISSISVTIVPPRSTGLAARDQQQFTLAVEDGSVVRWKISTSRPVVPVFIFNNNQRIALSIADTDSTSWTIQQTVTKPGFYQVQLDDEMSELYQVSIIEDKPVVIRVIKPSQYTTLQAGAAQIVKLAAVLSDDYSIASAAIVATQASGKGESVSFKEEQLGFDQPVGGQHQASLTRTFDLAAMGLKAGDELYFYIRAKDSRGQESRSDMFFISLPDTEELLSLSGLTSPAGQVPEYFRSQRQIILDTEKLLKERSSIPEDSFRLRSNELGNDQKLLRLRYGKFLGEENETGAHSAGDGHDHGESPAYGDVQTLMDEIGHKHDNAEDPDFFEPAQKAQLKAVLAEMWSSELKLRTYLPSAALPFEYKALQLLKDLQQKSRAYVGKTALKSTPLNPAKRLTGDLSAINTTAGIKNTAAADPDIQLLRDAIAALESMRDHAGKSKNAATTKRSGQAGRNTATSMQSDEAGNNATGSTAVALQSAERIVSNYAMNDPSSYLPAMAALRKINRDGAADLSQIKTIQSALKKMIGAGRPLPQAAPAAGSLGQFYFNQLNKKGR